MAEPSPDRDNLLLEVLTAVTALIAGQSRLEAVFASLRRELADAAAESVRSEVVRLLSNNPSGNSGGGSSGHAYGSRKNSGDEQQEKDFVSPFDEHRDHSAGLFTSIPDRTDHGKSWPASIQCREQLRQLDSARRQSLMRLGHCGSSESCSRIKSGTSANARSTFVIDPTSNIGTFLEVCSVLALVHDFVLIPYVMAWEVPFKGMLFISAVLATVYWGFDAGLRFFIGYFCDGELERRRSVIANRYMRTFFLPNIFAVLCDVVSLLLPASNPCRFLFRFADVLRIPKLVRLAERFQNWRLSDAWHNSCRGLNLFLAILWLNHVVCCAWYVIGRRAPSDTGGHWLDTLADTSLEGFDSTGSMYQYFTAFHWSISQMTAGGMDVGALNSVERQFSVCCLIFGVLFVSSLVSSLSASMTQIKMAQHDQTQKMRALRHYLIQNAITPQVAVRIQKQASQRLAKRERLMEKDVPALALLSSSLLCELRYEIAGTHLLQHPLLLICSQIDQATVQNICDRAVSYISLSCGDSLFSLGVDAAGAYCITNGGSILYTLKPASGLVDEDTVTQVTGRLWLCEVALWTEWKHVGGAEAQDTCELLGLGASSLLAELAKHPMIRTVITEYSRQFHMRLVSSSPPDWPNDLNVPFTDFSELVLAMDPAVQILIGTVTLQKMRQGRGSRTRTNSKTFRRLEDEVTSGRCTVMMTSKGQVERAVAVSILRVERDDGCFLVHLGKYIDGITEIICKHPGAKQDQDEIPSDAAQRLMVEVMPVTGTVQIKYVMREMQWQDSPTYGTRTRYLRSVFHAEFKGPPKVEPRAVPPRGTDPGKELESDVASLLFRYDVYMVEHQASPVAASSIHGQCNLYAWLPPEEMSRLGNKDSNELVLKWLGALEIEAFQPLRPPPEPPCELIPLLPMRQEDDQAETDEGSSQVQIALSGFRRGGTGSTIIVGDSADWVQDFPQQLVFATASDAERLPLPNIVPTC